MLYGPNVIINGNGGFDYTITSSLTHIDQSTTTGNLSVC